MVGRLHFPIERTELYSPIGLLPTDLFTGVAPIGRLIAFLDAQDGNGNWRKTDVKAVTTPSGVIAYPGLGRMAEAAGAPSRRYRVRIEAEFYLPLYLLDSEGIEFDAFPYNDSNPPANAQNLSAVQTVMLAPAPNYPFPDHIFVLRGEVKDEATKEPAYRVEVFWGNRETTLTTAPPDGEGKSPAAAKSVFALPLRIDDKAKLAVKQEIDALDHRTGRTGNIKIEIPKDLRKNNIISIS